jgi:hypothetical protein
VGSAYLVVVGESDPALLVPGSRVLQRPRARVDLDDHLAW